MLPVSPSRHQVYYARALAAKQAYEEAIRLDPSLAAPRAGSNAGGSSTGNECILPLGRIKKIMDLDKDKGKINKEALVIMEKATVRGGEGRGGGRGRGGVSTVCRMRCLTVPFLRSPSVPLQEQFLMWLATRTHHQALGQKRKGLRPQDVEHLVRTQPRLEFLRAPLKRDFERFAAAEAIASEGRKERMAEMQRAKKQKADATTHEPTDDVHEGAEDAPPPPETTKSNPRPQPTRTIDSMFRKV